MDRSIWLPFDVTCQHTLVQSGNKAQHTFEQAASIVHAIERCLLTLMALYNSNLFMFYTYENKPNGLEMDLLHSDDHKSTVY